jgi:hypothetical protein
LLLQRLFAVPVLFQALFSFFFSSNPLPGQITPEEKPGYVAKRRLTIHVVGGIKERRQSFFPTTE